MNIITTPIKDLLVVETDAIQDSRGSFSRFFCPKPFSVLLKNKQIAQVNCSITNEIGAIRGLHFQRFPALETKFVRCIKGKVFDVAVDLRKNSSTFLHWYGLELSSQSRKMMVIPEGFAHGFQVIEEKSEMLYLHTEFYQPEHEAGLLYNDPTLAINWPLSCTELSEKDKSYPLIDQHYSGAG
ncbi:dTDP-4-dehydrorhamnose 3,5-epimerase [Colwellia sp. M166]|uniref:dTDP-4-dehydrorhamnose 3,5-epimerase n=1 Tax=Colwellia sp. M166 TaxID=2583805 RepID=UPI00211F1113|nr:dTDP-4-dehydrorhamnose 3,5-epimerase [Colwellia sp. M166]UUO23128.1 dTDP-4-dehydrorhamnose 3,5-epimerase [Colwellia sp. M166]|tara:strand:+ start:512 stop:1060 length:549 start_codon:yes stop_codon:yes gene_type:complete